MEKLAFSNPGKNKPNQTQFQTLHLQKSQFAPKVKQF